MKRIVLLGMMLVVSEVGPHTRAARPAGPLAVVYLFDFTVSVTNRMPDAYAQFNQATDALVQGLRRGDTLRFGIVTSHLTLSPIMTMKEIDALRTSAPVVPDRDRYGPSPIWDAIETSVATLDRDAFGRGTIILVSDGRATGDVHSCDEVIAHAKRVGVAISTIVEDTLERRPGTPVPVTPFDTWKKAADQTGGIAVLDDGMSAAGGIARQMLNLLARLHSG